MNIFSSKLKVAQNWFIVQRIRILRYERRDESSNLSSSAKLFETGEFDNEEIRDQSKDLLQQSDE